MLKREIFFNAVGRKMIFPFYLPNLHDISRTGKDDLTVLKKTMMIYRVFTMFNESLPCLLSTEKFWFWTFQRWKIRSFLILKVDVGWYFIHHGMPCLLITEKNLILNFSEIGSTKFLYPKCWCKMIFYLAWNTIFIDQSKNLVFDF